MIIYLLIYIPFLFCAYYDFVDTNNETKNKILWFWVIVFTLFRGLRWETGTDWEQFHDVFYDSDWSNIFTYNRDDWSDKVMDYGYMFINALIHTSGYSYTIFLFITNYWIMWCYKDFSQRHTTYPILTFIMLMNVGVPFPVRQTIAMATSLLSYRFAVEKRWAVFVLLAFAATLIHKGSIIVMPIVILPYIIERFNIKWWYYAIAYMCSFLIASILSDYIKIAMIVFSESNEQLQAYSDSYMSMESTSVDYGGFSNSMAGGLSYTIFFILLLYIREKYRTVCENNVVSFEFFFFLYAAASIVNNIFRQADASGMSEILGRVTSTFDMLPVILPLIFIVLIPKVFNNPRLAFMLFFLYMSYKYWQQIPGSFFSELFIPYKSVIGL